MSTNSLSIKHCLTTTELSFKANGGFYFTVQIAVLGRTDDKLTLKGTERIEAATALVQAGQLLIAKAYELDTTLIPVLRFGNQEEASQNPTELTTE